MVLRSKSSSPVHRYWRWLTPSEEESSGGGRLSVVSTTTDTTTITADVSVFDTDASDTSRSDGLYETEEHLSLLFGGTGDDDSSLENEQKVAPPVENKSRRWRNNNPEQKQFEHQGLWNQHWLPEGPWKIGKNQILLDVQGVKLFKFFLVSVLSILLVHYYAIYTNADHDESYSLREMVLFDGNHIVLDMVVFFVVGRLYETPSIDSFSWMVPSIGAAITLSLLASNSDSLHHSLTAYEMHCTWTWQFWAVLIFGALPTIVGLVVAHLVYAARRQSVLQKLLELALGFSIFLMPYASNSFFHLHHWYYAWTLGMHANANNWWSRLTMCMMWGIYLNGIAMFGRDPVMTCAVTLYQSQNQQCPFLIDQSITLEALAVTSAASLDWRNCSEPQGSL